MSAYDSEVTGHLTIEPPLKWSEIKDSPFYASNSRRGTPVDLVFDVTRDESATEGGVVATISASRAIPRTSSPFGAYNLLDDIKEMVSVFGQKYVICGEFILVGEDSGDIRRIVVDSDGVREEKARFLWPNGDEVRFP